MLRLDSHDVELAELVRSNDSDFFTPAVEAEMDAGSVSWTTVFKVVALRGRVVERGSSALRSSRVSGTLERRLDDSRVNSRRSHPLSSSSVTSCKKIRAEC